MSIKAVTLRSMITLIIDSGITLTGEDTLMIDQLETSVLGHSEVSVTIEQKARLDELLEKRKAVHSVEQPSS